MALEIEGFEDRSGQATLTEHSFGYVYFNDGSRVGYTGPLAAGDPASVWEPRTNGGGEYKPVTSKHLRMAARHLHKEGLPKLPLEVLG
jgi:hypothetical protein